MKAVAVAVLTILWAGSPAPGQPSDADLPAATRRLDEPQRAARAAATRPAIAPATRPAVPASRPATRPATQPATQPGQATAAKTPARVVFLVDSTGSMIRLLADAKRDVTVRVNELAPGASFGIVCAADGGTAKAFQKALVPAGPAAVRQAVAFLEDQAAAGTDGGYRESLGIVERMRPQVVWFCTDADFNEPPKVRAALLASAKRGGYRLNILWYEGPDKKAGTAAAELAEATGGVCVRPNGERVNPP